eukprot:1003153-Amphidinium_carterae.1
MLGRALSGEANSKYVCKLISRHSPLAVASFVFGLLSLELVIAYAQCYETTHTHTFQRAPHENLSGPRDRWPLPKLQQRKQQPLKRRFMRARPCTMMHVLSKRPLIYCSPKGARVVKKPKIESWSRTFCLSLRVSRTIALWKFLCISALCIGVLTQNHTTLTVQRFKEVLDVVVVVVGSKSRLSVVV